MSLPVFPVTPLDASYQQTAPEEAVGTALDGGGGKYRRDYSGGVVTVRAQWLLKGLEIDVMTAFVYTTLGGGSSPFTLRAAVLSGATDEHTAQIVPGSLRQTRKQGDLQWWSAELEVQPPTRDATFDANLVALYGIYGPSLEPIMKATQVFVNKTLPAKLGWLL